MNYDYALDPGIWATQVDNNGDLVLGGKMIILGNWGGTKADGQVVGSKAGHICLDIVAINVMTNIESTTFYILAPVMQFIPSVRWRWISDNGWFQYGGSQVTGALGILHPNVAHMKGENPVKLVLNTADTNINGYDENIHGQGMLDLDEATNPRCSRYTHNRQS